MDDCLQPSRNLIKQLRRARDKVCDTIDQIDDDDPRFHELHRKADALLDEIHALS